MIYIIYVTRLPVGFFLDRVADGARGSIPFGKLVLGTILHFIFIINAVERRREKKIEKSEEAKRRERGREREKERMEKRKKSSGGVFARTGIWPCCVAAPPRESEFLFTAVALVASRVDRCIEKKKITLKRTVDCGRYTGLKKNT